jgi:hypothetical protein
VPGRSLTHALRTRLVHAWSIALSAARLARATIVAQTLMRLEWFRVDREAAALVAERSRLLTALGDAVYRGERQAARQARVRLSELDGRIEAAEARRREAYKRMVDRIEETRAESGRTAAIEIDPQ